MKSLGYRTHQAGKWHLGARPEWIPNFNIAADPHEKTDRAKAESQKLAELQEKLEAERAKDNPTLPTDLKGLPN